MSDNLGTVFFLPDSTNVIFHGCNVVLEWIIGSFLSDTA